MKKKYMILTSSFLFIFLSACTININSRLMDESGNQGEQNDEPKLSNYGEAMTLRGYEAEPNATGMKLSFSGIYEDKYYIYYFDLGAVKRTPIYSSIGVQYMNQDFDINFTFEECSSESISNQSHIATETSQTKSRELGFNIGIEQFYIPKIKLPLSGSYEMHWKTADSVALTKAESNEKAYVNSYKTGYSVHCQLSEEKGFRRGYTYRVSFFETVRCYGVLLYDFDNDVYTYGYDTILETSNKVLLLEESSNTYGEFDYDIEPGLVFDFDSAIEMAKAEEPKFDKRVILDNQNESESVGTIYLDNNGNYVGDKPNAPQYNGKTFVGYYSQKELGSGECYIDSDMNLLKPIETNIVLFAHWVKTSNTITNHNGGEDQQLESRNNDESNWNGLWQGSSALFSSGYTLDEISDAINGGYKYAKIRIRMDIFEENNADAWDWIAFKTIKNGQYNGDLQIFKVSVKEGEWTTAYFNFTIDVNYLADSSLEFQLAYGISGSSKNVWKRGYTTTEFALVKNTISSNAENISEGGSY